MRVFVFEVVLEVNFPSRLFDLDLCLRNPLV